MTKGSVEVSLNTAVDSPRKTGKPQWSTPPQGVQVDDRGPLGVVLRDRKLGDTSPVIGLSLSAWQAFCAGCKRGEFAPARLSSMPRRSTTAQHRDDALVAALMVDGHVRIANERYYQYGLTFRPTEWNSFLAGVTAGEIVQSDYGSTGSRSTS